MNIKTWQERMHECDPYGDIEDFKQAEIDELRAENAELKKDLIFVERWANHHGTKSCHSAESILGVIQHYPSIKAITKSYADGVLPTTPDPYAENTAQRKVLEQALEALNNSADHVVNDYNEGLRMYDGFTSRRGKVAGLKALAEAHQAAITAIQEQLK